MKQTIDTYAFLRAFESFEGRTEQLGGSEGLGMLFDYLEDLERSQGEEYELDVIGLCCDYACDKAEDIAESYGRYGINVRDMTKEECSEAVMAYLNDYTIVVGQLSDGRILYQQF